jgi:hypothetical protein
VKNYKFIVVILFAISLSCAKPSPRESTTGFVNGVKITVDYGAPSVKGRVIWGNLEPYNTVWRAGANENTTISFDKEIFINGKNLPAAKYGFFIIPKENKAWTIIFNKTNDAWGAFTYQEEQDVLRADINPIFVKDSQEKLNFVIEENNIVFSWEKVKLSIPISIK